MVLGPCHACDTQVCPITSVTCTAAVQLNPGAKAMELRPSSLEVVMLSSEEKMGLYHRRQDLFQNLRVLQGPTLHPPHPFTCGVCECEGQAAWCSHLSQNLCAPGKAFGSQ
jgi:hypothetical protein